MQGYTRTLDIVLIQELWQYSHPINFQPFYFSQVMDSQGPWKLDKHCCRDSPQLTRSSSFLIDAKLSLRKIHPLSPDIHPCHWSFSEREGKRDQQVLGYVCLCAFCNPTVCWPLSLGMRQENSVFKMAGWRGQVQLQVGPFYVSVLGEVNSLCSSFLIRRMKGIKSPTL